MGDDDAPTGIAPTELAEPHTAWSLDDGEDWEPPRRSWRPVIAAVVASLFVVGVAGGIAVDHLRPEPVAIAADTPVHAAPEPEPTAAPAPKPTATFVADVPDARKLIPPPPAQVPVTTPSEYDPAFLMNMKAKGWAISDPALMAMRAHQVCGELQRGTPPDYVVQQVLKTAGGGYSQQDVFLAQQFVSTVMSTYPDCP